MPRTMIVATDFSVRSDRALLRAELIARQTGAKLVLTHIVDEDQSARLISSTRQAAESLLAETVSTRSELGIDVQWLVRVSDIASGILVAADEVDADLIIVGPHRSRARDVFTGTTAERVLKSSKRPLLVAVEAPIAHYRRTLLAVDFDEPSKAAACAALELGVFDHTLVTVMHAFDTPAEGMLKRGMVDHTVIEEYRADERQNAAGELRRLLAELGLPRTTTRVAAITGTPARTILESSKREDADLIVVGTSQRKGFERLLVGSVTSDVIRDSERDILIVPVP